MALFSGLLALPAGPPDRYPPAAWCPRTGGRRRFGGCPRC